MAFKQFEVDGIGIVHVYKRAGVRNLRLSVQPNGDIRVTIPAWAPYATGVNFAQSRAEWLRKHAVPKSAGLIDGQIIGKSHRLKFVTSAGTSRPMSRIRQTQVVISYPARLGSDSETVQKVAVAASLRALKVQASHLLPMRLEELSKKHDLPYKSVGIKNLKTRWGSCDQDTNITLNLYLMQLPWHLIDYVLLHELTHTKVMRHGPPFWAAMEQLDPKTQALRREIKAYKTTLA